MMTILGPTRAVMHYDATAPTDLWRLSTEIFGRDLVGHEGMPMSWPPTVRRDERGPSWRRRCWAERVRTLVAPHAQGSTWEPPPRSPQYPGGRRRMATCHCRPPREVAEAAAWARRKGPSSMERS